MSAVFCPLIVFIVGNGLVSILIRLMGKDEKRAELPSFLFQFLGALIFLFFIKKFPPLSIIWLFPLAASFFYGLASILMFKAFEKGDVSLLSPLGNINSAITLIFSFLLLKESITLPKLLGIILLIYGLSFLKKQKSLILSLKALAKDRNCQYYLGFLVIFTLARVFDKKATPHFETISYSFLVFLIPSLFILFYIGVKKEFSHLIDFAKKKIFLAAITGLVTGIKYAAFYIAISLDELSLVSPLASLSTLVTLFLAELFLKERVEKRWWAAILMAAGAGVLASEF